MHTIDEETFTRSIDKHVRRAGARSETSTTTTNEGAWESGTMDAGNTKHEERGAAETAALLMQPARGAAKTTASHSTSSLVVSRAAQGNPRRGGQASIALNSRVPRHKVDDVDGYRCTCKADGLPDGRCSPSSGARAPPNCGRWF